MIRVIAVIASAAACGAPPVIAPSGQAEAPLSGAAELRMVTIPAGRYIAGSTPEERDTAYDEYLSTAGVDTARKHRWFDKEADRHVTTLPDFVIDLLPVTQAEYAEFVAANHASPPTIDEPAWRAQGFQQDWETEVARFVWKDGSWPIGRADHPAVLVTHDEASRYCAWRGQQVGRERRLPRAAELEKAARGDNGMIYPWGPSFDAGRLNSAVAGPRDTVPVGSFPEGASMYGVLDLAGNVFQWTSTVMADGRMMVKGSAWDDFGGLGRGASGHGRPAKARHVIVGFRCAGAG
jgi:toxoflavin biosynthesis protein ToxD